ncbi:MAG TPA: cellulase family glycosylhydrolase, partial [Solirubrobacteraceae bacterium]|nr:cellulase family glycosylhydrolase [Solirubrobacteraceae bacterium]
KSAMGQIASMGFTYVRLTAGWSAISPSSNAARIPGAPFDPSNPATYPTGGFQRLDRAVRDAQADGLKVMIDVAFWAPRWAVPLGAPDGQNRFEPNPTLFGDFASAVAQRYSGSYPDPAVPGSNLPAVQLYTIWNEPNESEFLQPQWQHTSVGWISESAQLYRGMYNSAYGQIKSVNAADKVLIGATSAAGSPTSGQGDVTPIQFVENLACVDSNLHPLDIPQCAGFQPLRADGYANHPYSMNTTPGASASDSNDVPLANTSRLESLLRQLNLDGRITTNLPLYDTEYGYNTDPPDPYASFSPDQQAEFVGWSTYLAWRDPNTVMFSQFLLRDSAPGPGRPGSRQYWNAYQTGLYYNDGQAKPAAQAFKITLWAQRFLGPGSPLVTLFGKVPPGSSPQIVQVQSLSNGTWSPVPTLLPSCGSNSEFLTNRAGYFITTAPLLASTATYRLGWLDSGGNWEYGVPIPVDASHPALAAAPQLQPLSSGTPARRRLGRRR